MNSPKISKILVLYHANCADGFGAAFAAWKKFGNDAEYVAINYGDPMPEVLMRDVYILDFSFPAEVLNDMIILTTRLVLLDHHKTAFENYAGSEREFFAQALPNSGLILLDNSKSGALIAWEYFHQGKKVPDLIRHISDRDLWKFKLEGTKALHESISASKPWSFHQWTLWSNDLALEDMYLDGEAILKAFNSQVASIIPAARTCTIYYKNSGLASPEYFQGLAVNCSPMFASEVGNILATDSGTYGLCWYFDAETNKVKVSLRSVGDYDVTKIASKFGGGGHKNAAGFSVPMQILMSWL